ncbi:hypothetical protein [Alkalihalobacillus deserti]|uniref:hypothetical protein n=1 Tax=Alkalihalobacillus deserti TaxID=2879466 RepID=UPI001D14F1BF|nr:hypothetical protein [Alkalihalobacillus deserti]
MKKATKIAEKLLSTHLNETPYLRLPDYHFDQLEKGICCPICQTFYTTFTYTLLCSVCGGGEEKDTAVLRAVEEYKLIFPTSKITTNIIYEWCNKIFSKKIIQKILSNNFKPTGKGKASYYVNID